MKVVTVGRSSENDQVINDPMVSRHHLQIIQDDYGNYRLADFGSSNGTFVNGIRITGEVPLNPNDVVRIGNTTLPWRTYFSSQVPTGSDDPDPEPQTSGYTGYTMMTFILGLISIGIILYIVIAFFTSKSAQFVRFFGGNVAMLKLFPIYLKGYLGIGGQWFAMIAALVLGLAADFIDGVLDESDDNKLSSAGTFLGNAGVTISIIFIILAIFAESIAGL